MIPIIILLSSIIYCEVLWWLIENNKKPFDFIKRVLKFMCGLNFFLAIIVSSIGNLIFGAVTLLYYMVVLDYRKPKLN